ncbi:DNA repair protein RecN [Bernardetia sp. MNP-M8]|uniref:DNA repair protein RecN n=1 Tax=Bernardetia sp. MNP-M8 TaxID=3127470 RepID=UPI0030D0E2AE
MLKHLLIDNYALIEHLEIQPDSHLNVITGETGAGKSILRGALGLLAGNRADTKVLLNPDGKCVIEGTFDIANYNLKKVFEKEDIEYDTTCIIRRQIAPNGRSRAFINDMPVPLDSLKRIAVRLMDIHAQHDTMQLFSNDYQRDVLDLYANTKTLLEMYGQEFKQYRKIIKKYEELKNEEIRLRKEYDYNMHLLEELEKADLEKIDKEELEQELERLENVDFIRTQMSIAFNSLSDEEYSAENILREAVHALSKTSSFSSSFNALYERLNSAMIEIQDISKEIESESGELVTDEETAGIVKQILSALYHLENKHNVQSSEELIIIRDEIADKVRKVENFDDDLKDLKEDILRSKSYLTDLANQLTEQRKSVVEDTQNQINYLLGELGMPNARFQIEITPIALSPSGADLVEFWFSANKGISPQPLKDVASGGEFSRLMLCIKYRLAKHISLPTLVFDEIDTGISGEIALKMGKIIQEMSKIHQVLIISHLPQVASQGSTHYFIYKDNSADRTVSRIKKLSNDERVKEIAQMIGGSTPSTSTYNSAKELLQVK